ncbi:MAG: autotransporter outer membrane beta-barrel domain-containing protein [Proteobacteria bacterium]|nr:autotransporter outer membrane beta-barrel domain-containing protein [Pseudomonadota bacterium]
MASLLAAGARAQTLDQQYYFYLINRCEQLGFARDVNQVLLPGQAGPYLDAFCSRPTSGAGGISTAALGGGAAAEELGAAGEPRERALERRRNRLHSATPEAAADEAPETELAQFGATSIFLGFDYLHERQVATDYEAGRRSDGYGGLLGADRRLGETALVGVALRYLHQTGHIDSGGDFTVNAPGLRVYGSWLPLDGLFVDAAVGFDRKGLDTRRIVSLRNVITPSPGAPPFIVYDPPPTPAQSSTHERDVSGELRAGYDFPSGRVSLGPRVAVTYAHAQLDAYLETGPTPMTLALDPQTRSSLRSLLGLQASAALPARTGVLVPQLNADWVHEYRDDQRLISAHFAEDLRPVPVTFQFRNNPPDRDWFVVRLSVAAVFPHGASAFAAIERTAGNAYIERFQANVGLRWELH